MNETNACPNPARLQELLAGALSAAAQAELARHLDNCEACRARLDELANCPGAAPPAADAPPVPETVLRKALDALESVVDSGAEPGPDTDLPLAFLDPSDEPKR